MDFYFLTFNDKSEKLFNYFKCFLFFCFLRFMDKSEDHENSLLKYLIANLKMMKLSFFFVYFVSVFM
ncbi:hypothetical protein IC575_019254 [Cucumis melo]